ncbi:MAG TPA: hypothetical protein PK057_03955 [Brevefilum fermentans]|nr:hypothetical protein [Brevefilum fermentans]
MHQIAIGSAGNRNVFTVIHGASVSAPAFKATCYFNFSADPFVSEHIEIELKGTSAQIESFIADLIAYFHYGALTRDGVVNAPLALRFQRDNGGHYFFAFMLDPVLAANPGSYLRQSQGSKLITIHYTRPNYFQGVKTPLRVKGLYAAGGTMWDYHLYNHTYNTVDSTVWVDPSDFITSLPAPIRVELKPVTASVNLTNLFIGLTHHPTFNGFIPFFFYFDTIASAAGLTMDASAIKGGYLSLTFAPSVWSTAFSVTLTSNDLAQLTALNYRPLLRFFAPHAYNDLFFRLQVIQGTSVIHTTEAVHSPPGFGYVLLPSLNLPPGPLLKEAAPQPLVLYIQALRESGAATTITTDYLTLFPFNPGAIFYAFHPVKTDALFIDDSAFSRHGFRDNALTGESVTHSRIGPPLVLYPQQINRLFFAVSDDNNLMPPSHYSLLNVSYYPRYALL